MSWQNYPIQLSVEILEGGVSTHAFDTLIRGAVRLGKWVRENVPIKSEELEGGIDFEEMVEKLASLVEPGTTIVAHNIAFDLEQTLARTAKRMEYESSALENI